MGAFGLGNALGAVAQGRLMDRLGQPRVLRPAAIGHVVALAVLVVAAAEGAPTGLLMACAAAGGLFLPQLPAAMRSLWGALRAGRTSSARPRTRWSRSSSRWPC